MNKALHVGVGRFKEAGIASARLEAELLLARATGWPRPVILLGGDKPVPDAALERFEATVARRCRREPLQQILGDTEFFGLRILVDGDVMAPRPETEVLVEQVVKRWRTGFRDILDIGTGSGCIAVALAMNIPGCSVDALDVSERALGVAGRNVGLHGLGDRVRLLRGDLFPEGGRRYDVIVSNPPYIPSGEIGGLMPEVSRHEPRLALDGGADGLDYYRKIVEGAAGRLKGTGMLALEVGQGQAPAVTALISKAPGWGKVETMIDLAGTERVVVAERREDSSP